ncbi:MAG: translation elongation factor Ts [Balneolales bacterium]
MSISASDVKELRDRTGAGMMDCKKALSEADGDMDAAIEFLRKKGQKVAEKRADREANEGLIVSKLSEDGKKAVALELNCETDFVAKNEAFIKDAEEFADLVYNKELTDLKTFKNEKLNGISVSEKLQEMVGRIGEKIDVNRFELLKTSGEIVVYMHPGNQLAVLVEFASSLDNKDLGRDVAMQIAAMQPIAINRDQVDDSLIQKELEIAKEQLINEGKPENIAEKAAQGKIRRFYEERVLLEQKFVKDGSITVGEYLKSQSAPDLVSFKRIQLGESE